MVRIHTVIWLTIVSMATVCLAGVETVTSEDGRFTILFADKPKVAQQVIRMPGGNVTMHILTADFPQQTGAMVVTYSDYPPQVLAARKPDQMLDDSVTGTIKGMKATLVKSGRIAQAGSPGREFSWTATGPKGPTKGQGRIFLVGPRLYQVLVIGTTETSISGAVYEMIFKSFEFKPTPPADGFTPETTKPAAPAARPRATMPGPASAKRNARPRTPARVQDPWITHTGVSFEGFWKVQMPARPKHTTEPGLFGVKVRNVHVASDRKLTYTLKIQVTPDDVLKQGKESVLAAARDRLAEEVGGKVVEESDARIAGYDGHAYRIEVAGPRPAVVAARAAIVGKRTVVLSVIGDRAAVAGPSADRFLSSFRVGN
jgi:hypothetical protein